MSERPVKGEEALKRMAGKALGKDSSSSKPEDREDPLKEAQEFTKQMAANVLIESEVAKAQASKEEAQARAAKAKAEAARAESGEDQVRSRPPVEVSGSVKLGDIDYGKMLEKSEAERDDLRKQAEDSARDQGQINDELREKIHDKDMEVLKVTFQAQMDMITKALEGSKASQKSLIEQLTDLRETAKAIGLAEPQGATDLSIQVELKKIDLDHQMALRKMTREDKASDRHFQLQLRELDDKRERDKQELQMQQKNQDFWKGAPAAIGQALAQGIKESQGPGITEEVTETKSRGKGQHIEVGKGEAGAIDCPDCGTEISIGPTARQGVCASCGLKLPVTRVSPETETVSEESESGLRPTY